MDSPIERKGSLQVGLATKFCFGEKDEENNVNYAIMHRDMSTRLFTAEVECTASAGLIARTFGMNEMFVRKNWIVEESVTPLTDELTPTYSSLSQTTSTRLFHSRPVDFDAVLSQLYHMPPSMGEGTDSHFSRKHEDVELNSNGRKATRMGRRGTYRCAQGNSELSKKIAESSYFEVEILSQEAQGGICIGVANGVHPLNKIVGFDRSSIGLFSTGEVIHNNRYTKLGGRFGPKDIVGVLFKPVHLGESLVTSQESAASSANTDEGPASANLENDCVAEVDFFINGKRVQNSRGLVPFSFAKGIYPTVSIYSEGTSVQLGLRKTSESSTES
uniref:SPRY domain-containing protein n=1 Tax=Rhodosorus marinus TaxID=101924 RepID=A0A7S0BR86_9RHOD|mmetsp:Transcript_5762/g.8121  ORF Transcript_5762/g.8121 Transcript_5762/m.8121 type:complete len:331 (+) Transcript_5762:385-1377(+)